jgi:hypothetical protein
MKRGLFILFIISLITAQLSAQNVFSVKGKKILLNGKEFQSIGLRCPNALMSDETTNELIAHFDEYKSYGLNTISVFFMGSRYSNINGFNLDATLKNEYAARMGKIIEACEKRDMVVLVGILYWGAQMRAKENAYYKSWNQENVNQAIRNTVLWLKNNKYKNVFIDPDNEGMAQEGAGFNIAEMICEGKKANPEIVIAYNGKGYPPPCADLPIHFGEKVNSMPYIESEGTPGNYWGDYSKEQGLNKYINVGFYTEGKKAEQLKKTKQLLDEGHGYLFASTWLQNIPPNYNIGGNGSPCNPGIKWWIDYINYRKSAENSDSDIIQLDAKRDFIIELTGYAPFYPDKGKRLNYIAVNAMKYYNEWAGAQTVFYGENGNYKLI